MIFPRFWCEFKKRQPLYCYGWEYKNPAPCIQKIYGCLPFENKGFFKNDADLMGNRERKTGVG